MFLSRPKILQSPSYVLGTLLGPLQTPSFFFLIYLFIFSCAGSSLLRVDFSLVASSGGDSLAASSGGDSLAVSSGGDSSCSVQPSHRSGFACGTQALGCVCSVVEACWL